MGNEYRKITMTRGIMWEFFRDKGKFEETEEGFKRFSKALGLTIVYPRQLYKLWNGEPLEPDYWREDDGKLKKAFCQERASGVKGRFTYLCGTFRTVDGKLEFVLSFDTEQNPEECLPNILFEYSWNKRDSFQAEDLPSEVIRDAHVLHGCGTESYYHYNGTEYYVVSATEERYREVMLDYYANLGSLINSANAKLDDFDRWKDKWRTEAFEAIAVPAIKDMLGEHRYATAMQDEKMIIKYTDRYQKNTVWEYRFDYVGWQGFVGEFGKYLPDGVLDQNGYPIGFNEDED